MLFASKTQNFNKSVNCAQKERVSNHQRKADIASPFEVRRCCIDFIEGKAGTETSKES